MQISQIVSLVNKRLAGELLSLSDIINYLDDVIDIINTRLNANFPTFSELPDGTAEYTAFPDKYIRTVVVPGAAYKYFVMDEEGIATAPKYEEEFLTNLFYMERDYMMQVPEEYAASEEQGVCHFDEEHPLYDGGLYLDVGNFTL